MIISAYLLFCLGVLGAADIWFFHTRAHSLRTHADARAELVTHALRGPTYATLFLLVPNFTFHGGWFIALLALYAVDLGISIADFWLEAASRSALGGLPRGEYLLHVLLAMLFGALVVATIWESAGALTHAAALSWRPVGDHVVVRAALALMAPCVPPLKSPLLGTVRMALLTAPKLPRFPGIPPC